MGLLVIVSLVIGNISFVFRHQITEAYMNTETNPHILYILAINAGMWSFFPLLQLNFQERNPLEFLKIFMILTAIQFTI